MTTTIISDCHDANAVGRQKTRATTLLGFPTNFISVSNDLEASGNLIDTLDAIDGQDGVVLVNVAPRNGTGKKWNNGTPFGYFWHNKTLILATIAGFTLSFLKKLHLVDSIKVVDISTCLSLIAKDACLSDDSKKRIIDSQFRSYDFLPYLAEYLLKNKEIQSEQKNLSETQDAPPSVWWIDNFGNCKTTVLPEELPIQNNYLVTTKLGALPFYPRLKDVPDQQPALIIGSSGYQNIRFLEIVIQGNSAAKHYQLSSGDFVL